MHFPLREIAKYVKDIQAFQDEAGRFDPAKYKDYLERSGKRAGQFERELADSVRAGRPEPAAQARGAQGPPRRSAGHRISNECPAVP